MRRPLPFWRNVAIIALVHLAVLFGLVRWSGETKRAAATEVLWLNGEALALADVPAAMPEPSPVPPPDEAAETPLPSIVEPEQAEAIVQPVAGDLALPIPAATPVATPKPSPALERKASPKPSPKRSATPKKTLLAKTSPAKSKPKPSGKSSLASSVTAGRSAKPTVTVTSSSASGPSAGGNSGAGTGGASGSSEFAGYYRLLHERFSSEWEQPTSVVASGAKMSALVRVRIEQDGRVSEFSIARSSGNVLVDESIGAIAGRVPKVDPLPAGLGSGGHHEVTIGFGLNADQP